MSDYEMPDVFDEATIVARKRHRCCECRGFIEIGERHEHIKGLWDGRWSNYRTCHECAHARKLANKIKMETELGSLVNDAREDLEYRKSMEGGSVARHIIDTVIRNAELRGSQLSEDPSWEEDILITHHQ